MKVPAIGDLVYLEEYGYAEVTYIEYKNLYNHHFKPIQVTLENPYDHEHYVIRVSLLDIREGET
jgi:hypothetical protein